MLLLGLQYLYQLNLLEYYLKSQMEILKQAVGLFADKYKNTDFTGVK